MSGIFQKFTNIAIINVHYTASFFEQPIGRVFSVFEKDNSKYFLLQQKYVLQLISPRSTVYKKTVLDDSFHVNVIVSDHL